MCCNVHVSLAFRGIKIEVYKPALFVTANAFHQLCNTIASKQQRLSPNIRRFSKSPFSIVADCYSLKHLSKDRYITGWQVPEFVDQCCSIDTRWCLSKIVLWIQKPSSCVGSDVVHSLLSLKNRRMQRPHSATTRGFQTKTWTEAKKQEGSILGPLGENSHTRNVVSIKIQLRHNGRENMT